MRPGSTSKDPSHDPRRKVRGRRVSKPVKRRRNSRKSPEMGDSVTLANPEASAPATPMDLDKDLCGVEESTAPQPSPSPAPPDLTPRQSEASRGNDGEEHARSADGGGDGNGDGNDGEHAATAIPTARDDTVDGDLRGRAASQARPPGSPTTHTTSAPADLDNGFDNESLQNWVQKQLLNLTIRLDKSDAQHNGRQDDLDRRQSTLEAQQGQQCITLNDHQVRLNKHDSDFQSLREGMNDIKSMLKNEQDCRQNEEADRKKEKAQKEERRKLNEERANKNEQWLKQLMADVAVLRLGGHEHTQSDSGPPPTPTPPRQHAANRDTPIRNYKPAPPGPQHPLQDKGRCARGPVLIYAPSSAKPASI